MSDRKEDTPSSGVNRPKKLPYSDAGAEAPLFTREEESHGSSSSSSSRSKESDHTRRAEPDLPQQPPPRAKSGSGTGTKASATSTSGSVSRLSSAGVSQSKRPTQKGSQSSSSGGSTYSTPMVPIQRCETPDLIDGISGRWKDPPPLATRSGTSTPFLTRSHASSESEHSGSVKSDTVLTAAHVKRHPMMPGEAFYAAITDMHQASYRCLMLRAGQGGTFAYGREFRDENGESIEFKPWRSVTKSKIRHLESFGNSIQFIGTDQCFTCAGVFFEIEGNRCFCAHINGWFTSIGGTFILEGSEPYEDIKSNVARHMHEHAKNHGWDRDDVDIDTLKIVSPHPDMTGWAIVDGIHKFLGLGVKNRSKVMLKKHGFLIAPGAQSKSGGMVGKYLGQTERASIDDATRIIWHEVPPNFEQVPFIEKGTLVDQDWTYTTGSGWHQLHILRG